MVAKRKIVLLHYRAPGDTLVLTGLVRDIALAHPGKFEIDTDTSAMDLWRHNPYLTKLQEKGKPRRDVEYIKIQYGKGIRDQNYEPVHFLHYFHRDFEQQLRVHVPPQLPYPDLHLSTEERDNPVIRGRYWVVISGGKSDFTAKVWSPFRMQRVTDALLKMGLQVVQIGSNDTGHWHPPLEGAINLVAKTSLRDMMRLIHHSDGVICGVTCAMHMAAALQRPCVVTGGGREAWWWEAYVRENRGLGNVREKLAVPHKFLHTIGLLPCCQRHGCWKNKTVRINDDRSVCVAPLVEDNYPIPKCMHMITVDHVLEAVMEYYADGTLPPINQTVSRTLVGVPTAPRRLLDLFGQPLASQEPPKPPEPPKPAGVPTIVPGNLPMPMVASTAPACKIAQPNRQQGTMQIRIPQEQMQQILAAKLEGRGDGERRPIHVVPAGNLPTQMTAQAAQIPDSILDHPDVGGKFTICVLLYGPEEYYDLHVRCLNSIIGTVEAKRMDLRVGSNELNAKSLAFVEQLRQAGLVTKHYRHEKNDYKYPVMREMFFDPTHPITTKWVVWFDDDSIANKTPDWLKILATAIVQHHQADNAHMFGATFIWTLGTGQKEWVASRPWYRKRPFRLQNGQPSPSGNKILFATGGWWAISHEAIMACDIPDPNIGHNGGDYMIGEQLYQGGYNLKNFNAKKQFIHTSSVPRRGVTMPMPGMQATTGGGHGPTNPRA